MEQQHAFRSFEFDCKRSIETGSRQKGLMAISIHNAIAEASQLLSAAGVNEARMEAGSLLAAVVGRDRTFLIAHSEDALAETTLQTFRSFVQRRVSGEPLQYIVGHQEFFQ